MRQSGQDYNNDWFIKRAFESLYKISPNVWDYSDSLLLYLPSGVQTYESLQETDTPYSRLVTKPEREYLQAIAQDVVNQLPGHFEYIDLGPGTEHKEQFFFDELKKQGKTFTYIPVDISEYYLSLAEKHASDQGIPVNAIQAAFEELPDILGEATLPRFVNLGLTFSNYDPEVILNLLKSIAGENGFVFINSQMKDRVDIVSLRDAYSKDAVTLADGKLELLGLDPHIDVTPRETTDEIKCWCSIINPSDKLKEKGIVAGDKLLVFQSLRYTKDQLIHEIEKVSSQFQLFDTSASFIAVLVRI
jgi:hypothetical protein